MVIVAQDQCIVDLLKNFDFFHDERVRSVFLQLLTVFIVCWVAWFLVSNTAHNLEKRGLSFGWGFLGLVAPFDPDFKLISFTVGVDTYSRILLIGILNTLYVSFLTIIGTTFLGFSIGIMRTFQQLAGFEGCVELCGNRS